jgi:hypothetical protein
MKADISTLHKPDILILRRDTRSGFSFLLLAVYIAYESGVDLKTVGKGTQNRCAIMRSQPSIWGGTLEELLHSQEDLEMLEMNAT